MVCVVACCHADEACLACVQALSVIEEQKAASAAARKKAEDLKAGMDIFSIPQPPYKELATMDKDLEQLSNLWGVVAEWETNYNSWKLGKFREIKVQVQLLYLPRWVVK